MDIGSFFNISYGNNYQQMIVLSTCTNTFNGTKYEVYNLLYNHTLYVKAGTTISNPLNIKGHLIKDTNEILNGSYYLKANLEHVLPICR